MRALESHRRSARPNSREGSTIANDGKGDGYRYDTLFYEYQRSGSARSARALLPHVVGALGGGSVLDVGCGAGAWLAAYGELGVEDCIGVDGDYVDRSVLMIDPDRFLPRDIARPFDLGRRFDLVQCLEVGEHLPTAASATLVDNIVRHGSRVLFSSAVPGQGGEEHVNEQPYEFWRDRFAERGFRLFDFVRPRVRGDSRIERWYRCNVLFFCHDDALRELPPAILAARLPDDMPVSDFSPPGYRFRKALLRFLPPSTVSTLAVLKHRVIVHASKGR